MKSGSLYTFTPTDDGDISVQCGSVTLSCSFRWPEVIQENYDIVMDRYKQMPASDPMIQEDHTPLRNYDYIQYYLDIPDVPEDMYQWLVDQTVLPQSLWKKNANVQRRIIEERKVLCKELKEYIEDLEDMLHYQMVIIDQDGNTVVTDVLPGGWFNHQDNNWALSFTADVDRIGKDQLNLLTVEVEVYDAA